MISDDFSTWNVVIIDDDPDSIRVLEFIFSFHNVKMRTASSGEEGLELLKQVQPTCVFLDIQMPKMSGWEVLKVIRSNPALQDLIVVAVTAHAMVGDRESIMNAGFDGYVAKPVSPLTFMNELKSIVAQKALKKAEISELVPTKVEPSQPALDKPASTEAAPTQVEPSQQTADKSVSPESMDNKTELSAPTSGAVSDKPPITNDIKSV